jgi:hypothetical protein
MAGADAERATPEIFQHDCVRLRYENFHRA